MNKKVYSETQKRKILEEFKNSTESQRVFCQRIGAGRATLRKWLAKKIQKKKKQQILE